MPAPAEIFILAVCVQLFLPNAAIYEIESALIGQAYDVLVPGFSRFGTELRGKAGTCKVQAEFHARVICRPANIVERIALVSSTQANALREA